MSGATEELNRRLLRARDAMDRTYAQPLDIPALAPIALVSEAHFIRTFRAAFGETPHRYLQRRRVERAMFLLRRTDAASPTSASMSASPAWARSPARSARSSASRPPQYRRRGDVGGVPVCFAMAWTRPSSFGEATAPATRLACASDRSAPRRNRRVQRTRHLADLRARPGPGARLLRRQARSRGQQRPGPRLHALAHGRRARGPGPADPAGEARPAGDGRRHRRAGARPAHQGSRRRPPVLHDDDCRATYEELLAKGVEFTQEPTEQPYGIDCGLRDPFGNHIRFSQPIQAVAAG